MTVKDLPEFVIIIGVCGSGFFMLSVMALLWKYIPILLEVANERTLADKQLAAALAQLSVTLKDTLDTNMKTCADAQEDYLNTVSTVFGSITKKLEDIHKINVSILRNVEELKTTLKVRAETRKGGKDNGFYDNES